jgi:hypothetical protein
MRNALSELASINSQTSAHLREILESHGVSFNHGDKTAPSRARGTAQFTAFDPDYTCLRFPPLTVRFFQDAVKFNVLTNAEAQEISFQVALCCQKHGQEYKGAFSTNLSSSIFGDFLTGALTRNGFLYRESVYGWCVDAFAAQMPWPVIPDFHLRVTGYRPARVSRQGILGGGRGPFLRFVNAIDIAALGARGGLSVTSVMQALSWLNEPSMPADSSDVALEVSETSERLVLPFFSYGFQGAVFGTFTGLEASQKEPVFKALVQFGQSLSDAYASLRRNDCLQILKGDRDVASIASAFLKVVSPIEHLIVEKDGRFCSYSLEREDGYWAKYRELRGAPAAELSQQVEFQSHCFKIEQHFMGDRFRLIIKPVEDSESLDPIFTWISLEARLSEALHVQSAAGTRDPLSLSMLTSMKEALESKSLHGPEATSRSRGDIGRLKRLCIIELIIENFERGDIELTNHTLKSRLEKKLGSRAPIKLNGYQIAGRALQRVQNEFAEEFRRSVKFEAIGSYKVRLSWTHQ